MSHEREHTSSSELNKPQGESLSIMDKTFSRRTFIKGAIGALGTAAFSNFPLSEASATPNEHENLASSTETLNSEEYLSIPSTEGDPLGVYEFTPETLPEGSQEIIAGSVWFGDLTPVMRDAVETRLQEYGEAGVPDLLAMGLPETWVSLYVKTKHEDTGEEKIREIAIGERGAYHIASLNGGPTLFRLLAARSIADGKVQLDVNAKEYHHLSPQSAAIIANTPITGEEGSQVPSFGAMRRSLTINGDNHAHPHIGGYALNQMDKDGNPDVIEEDKIEDMLSLLRSEHATDEDIKKALRIKNFVEATGHNITEGMEEFLSSAAGEKALEIYGYPISEPYLVMSVIGGEPTPIILQVFERGSVTWNPKNPKEYQYEGGLIGNFTNSVITGRETPVRLGDEVEPGCAETNLPPTIGSLENGGFELDNPCVAGYTEGKDPETGFVQFREAIMTAYPEIKKYTVEVKDSPDEVADAPEGSEYSQRLILTVSIPGAPDGKQYINWNSNTGELKLTVGYPMSWLRDNLTPNTPPYKEMSVNLLSSIIISASKKDKKVHLDPQAQPIFDKFASLISATGKNAYPLIFAT